MRLKKMNHMSKILMTLPVVATPEFVPGQPARKWKERPIDRGLFVLPLKQSFIKDARIMPGTTRLVALLAGWIGNSNKWVIQTTQGILGKHLGRSVRQIYRYLQDAQEEGYLFYSCRKNRLGYITGISIWLNFLAVRRKTRTKTTANSTKQDRTLKADTKEKSDFKREVDPEFRAFIEKVCQRNGIAPPPLPS